MSAPSSVSISNIINFAGVLGLLVSLWFVNEEIEQSRMLAEAEWIQNRNHSLMAFYSAPLEGSKLAAQMMKSGAEIEIDWSDAEESAIYTAISRVRILSLLNAYNIYKYKLGVDEQTIDYTYLVAARIYDNCPLRDVFIQRVPGEFLLEVQKRSANNCAL